MAKKHIAKKAKWSNKQIFLRIILPILIVAVLTSLGFLLLKLLDNRQSETLTICRWLIAVPSMVRDVAIELVDSRAVTTTLSSLRFSSGA